MLQNQLAHQHFFGIDLSNGSPYSAYYVLNRPLKPGQPILRQVTRAKFQRLYRSKADSKVTT